MRKKFVVLIMSAAALAMSTTAIGQHSGRNDQQEHAQEKGQKYTCPMHPDVVMNHPGHCPKCGMKLVPVGEKKRSMPNSDESRANVQRPMSNSGHSVNNANAMPMP